VVVTQPNNKLSRILKALLKEVPAQLAAINAASMAASLAMADVNLAAIGGPGAAEAAKGRLQQRLQLIQALQVGIAGWCLIVACEQCVLTNVCSSSDGMPVAEAAQVHEAPAAKAIAVAHIFFHPAAASQRLCSFHTTTAWRVRCVAA
jgi:hypothetical protein